VKLLLTALGSLAGVALIVLTLTRVLTDVGKGVNQAAEEQQAREEQNRRMMAYSFEGMKARTFRELEDPDSKVRLEAVT
jgi:hypothetical protein